MSDPQEPKEMDTEERDRWMAENDGKIQDESITLVEADE